MKIFKFMAVILAALLLVIFASAQPPAGSGQAPAEAQQQGGQGQGQGTSAGRGGRGGAAQTVNFDDHTGFSQIFDGKTLNGWDGTTDIWRVENGEIVAESTADKPAGTTFLIYRGSEPADFELKLEMKIEGKGGNSGIQYRSYNVEPSSSFGANRGSAQGQAGGGQARGGAQGQAPGGQSPAGAPDGAQGQMSGAEARGGAQDQARGGQAAGGRGAGGGGMVMNSAYNKWNLFGPQADFDMNGNMAGQLFEGGRQPGERGITTSPGSMVLLSEGQQPKLLANIASAEELRSSFKAGDWNQYHIVVRGSTYVHILNGRLITVTVDDDATKRHPKGLIGLQIEGSELKVSFRNVWLKIL